MATATAASADATAAAARHTAVPEAGAEDDSFLEFLGQDDVDDAKWWEFFRRSAAQGHGAGDDPPLNEDET